MLAAFNVWWKRQRTLNELRSISEHAFAAGWAAALEQEKTNVQ